MNDLLETQQNKKPRFRLNQPHDLTVAINGDRNDLTLTLHKADPNVVLYSIEELTEAVGIAYEVSEDKRTIELCLSSTAGYRAFEVGDELCDHFEQALGFNLQRIYINAAPEPEPKIKWTW